MPSKDSLDLNFRVNAPEPIKKPDQFKVGPVIGILNLRTISIPFFAKGVGNGRCPDTYLYPVSGTG